VIRGTDWEGYLMRRFGIPRSQATGAPPFSYQWQSNEVNLADNGRISGSQTATLSINPVQVADTGPYQVVITNGYGSITSDIAMLTVTAVGAAPRITSQSAIRQMPRACRPLSYPL
jgi:hypothetical protein